MAWARSGLLRMKLPTRWLDQTVMATAALVAAATPLWADYVTDPTMCGQDPFATQEIGLRLDASSMWAIEYYCEWAPAIDFGSQEVQVMLGHCGEPGAIFPTAFAALIDPAMPNQINIYADQTGDPVVFYDCG